MLRLTVPDPPLAGGGVRLRPWGHADAEVLSAGWHDPEVGRWNPVPDDRSVDAARHWIGGWGERLRTGVAIDLAIVAEDGPDAVGEVGASSFDDQHGSAEIGFWLLPEARGRGFAQTAVRLLSAWVVDTVGVRLLFARTDPENGAGAVTLDGAGFTARGRASDDRTVWKFEPRPPTPRA